MAENEMHEPEEVLNIQAVTHHPQQQLMALPMETFGPNTVAKAKEVADIHHQLKLLLFRHATKNEVLDQNGKPYLTESLCMKAAGMWGVSYKNVKYTQSNYSDEVGPVVSFQAEVTAVFQNRQDTEYGSAASNEKFFMRYNGEGELSRVPLSEINIGNVLKKAITNAKGRATRKILGLTFTWEEINKIFVDIGRDPGDITSVEYKNKGKKGNGKEQAMTVTHTELSNKIFEMCGGDKKNAAEMLFNYSKFKNKDGEEIGARTAKKMSLAWAKKTLDKVNLDYDAFKAEEGGA
jgi:hypothetical protein